MAIDKYRRTNFLKEEVVDDVAEYDLGNDNWDLWEIKRPMTYFTLSRGYLARPDLLSLKLYGKMNYWWILLKHNKICDVWNDMAVGDIIEVPDVRDLEDFYALVRRRQRG
jgi:hypothetical protein